MITLPEEKDLNITADDVEWDREFIKEYEADIEKYSALAADSEGPRRGAYTGLITKAKKARDRMSGNLEYHLDWLKRFNPSVYEEVKE